MSRWQFESFLDAIPRASGTAPVAAAGSGLPKVVGRVEAEGSGNRTGTPGPVGRTRARAARKPAAHTQAQAGGKPGRAPGTPALARYTRDRGGSTAGRVECRCRCR